QHIPALAKYNANQIENVATGGDQAYDEAYWQTRAPRNMLAHVVADHIPAYMVGGYFDLYQRGEPLDYSELQNLWAARPLGAPTQWQRREPGQQRHADRGTTGVFGRRGRDQLQRREQPLQPLTGAMGGGRGRARVRGRTAPAGSVHDRRPLARVGAGGAHVH